jgi:predicted TPR repeat methyltransferase
MSVRLGNGWDRTPPPACGPIHSAQFQKAVEAYEAALTLAPASAEGHQNLGCALFEQRKLEAAICHFREALQLKPGLIEARIILGSALFEQGKASEALATAETAMKAVAIAPAMQYSLAVLLAKCGRRSDARDLLEACRKGDPADRQGAGLLLAAMGFAPMPARAPDALLDKLYAERAQSWDGGTATAQSYRGAEHVVGAFRKATKALTGLDVLDAGCGTGLIGPEVRAQARRLDGVDLSLSMLDRAREKQVYDALHREDLVGYMARHPHRFDAILSAATLIHFGDLMPAFQAAAGSVRPNGTFVFTLFPNEQDGNDVSVGTLDGFAQGGCFCHGASYVVRIAGETGFSVEAMDREVHEYHHGQPKMGLVVVLRRSA